MLDDTIDEQLRESEAIRQETLSVSYLIENKGDHKMDRPRLVTS